MTIEVLPAFGHRVSYRDGVYDIKVRCGPVIKHLQIRSSERESSKRGRWEGLIIPGGANEEIDPSIISKALNMNLDTVLEFIEIDAGAAFDNLMNKFSWNITQKICLPMEGNPAVTIDAESRPMTYTWVDGSKTRSVRVFSDQVLGEGTFKIVYAGEKVLGKAKRRAISLESYEEGTLVFSLTQEANLMIRLRQLGVRVCKVFKTLEFAEMNLTKVLMVSERCEESCKTFWKRASPLEKLTFIKDFAASVFLMNERGDCIHRDLKTDNIMMGSDGRIRIIDLGLSTTLSHTDYRLSAGTLDYMCPEYLIQQFSAEEMQVLKGAFKGCELKPDRSHAEFWAHHDRNFIRVNPRKIDSYSYAVVLAELLGLYKVSDDQSTLAALNDHDSILRGLKPHFTLHKILKELLMPNVKTRKALSDVFLSIQLLTEADVIECSCKTFALSELPENRDQIAEELIQFINLGQYFSFDQVGFYQDQNGSIHPYLKGASARLSILQFLNRHFPSQNEGLKLIKCLEELGGFFRPDLNSDTVCQEMRLIADPYIYCALIPHGTNFLACYAYETNVIGNQMHYENDRLVFTNDPSLNFKEWLAAFKPLQIAEQLPLQAQAGSS